MFLISLSCFIVYQCEGFTPLAKTIHSFLTYSFTKITLAIFLLWTNNLVDGLHLFFVAQKEGDSENFPYWVDASVINNLLN